MGKAPAETKRIVPTIRQQFTPCVTIYRRCRSGGAPQQSSFSVTSRSPASTRRMSLGQTQQQPRLDAPFHRVVALYIRRGCAGGTRRTLQSERAQPPPYLCPRDRTRLLRRMRAFASGLGACSDSTPTRLLHLSPKAAGLLSAYRHDPSWSSEALSAVAEGGVAARAFVGWAIELERVYREQPRVEAFLRCAFSTWAVCAAPAAMAAGMCLSSTAEPPEAPA